MAVRLAMLCGMEMVLMTKFQEAELEVAELGMLHFTLEMARLDRIRKECIGETVHVHQFWDKARGVRWRWFGHELGKDEECVERRILDMEPLGRQKRVRQKRRFMDAVKVNVWVVGVTEDTEDEVG